MRKILLLSILTIPFFGFSQLWNFSSSNQDWTKKGAGQYTVAAYGTTPGNLHLTVTGTTATNNFFVLENLVSNITTPLTNYKFLRVKLTNNSVVETMTLRADATNPTGANKSVTIVANSTTNTEYFIDLTGIVWSTGLAGTYELRFQKPAASVWGTSQYITIDEIEFMTDVVKNDHLFDVLDYWDGETNASNGTSIALSAGSLVVTPTGALNAKVKNDFYSIDAANKFIHIIYKNNSTNNNSLRVNYFSPTDTYATQKSFLNQAIVTGGSQGELIIDANSITDWTGNVRKLSIVLTNFDGTIEVPANVDTGTLEIERVVVNNSNTPLSTQSYLLDNDFYVYPNPVNDLLNVKSNVAIEKMQIYTLTGQLLKTQNFNSPIDISNLSSGVYLIKIYSNNKVSNLKFVKK